MLLLVMDAELDQVDCRGRERRQETIERLIDVSSICAHLIQRRAAEHTAPRSRMSRPFGFVIAVEHERPALVVCAVARYLISQHEGYEEPGRVGEVPLGRRGIGEGLNRCVGIAERSG